LSRGGGADMAMSREHPVLRFLRGIRSGSGAAGGSDAQLLAAFGSRGDEQAFAELVRRHGPMVFGVCARMLGPTPAAEDAFQAPFLVRARKARAGREPAALGNWLYGVAHRTASRARANAARRQARERQAPMAHPSGPAEEPVQHELRRVLDDELSRLPE